MVYYEKMRNNFNDLDTLNFFNKTRGKFLKMNKITLYSVVKFNSEKIQL